jgi:hypothetical protein
MAERRSEALTAAAEALAIHRWKSMGVSSAECECGTILYGDADPFPADEAFLAHLVIAVLEAAAPHLLAAEVSAHRAEQDAIHADLSQLLRVLGLGDHARPQSSHEVMLDAINEAGRLRAHEQVTVTARGIDAFLDRMADSLDAYAEHPYEVRDIATSLRRKAAALRGTP